MSTRSKKVDFDMFSRNLHYAVVRSDKMITDNGLRKDRGRPIKTLIETIKKI